jgi:hypothetical protein
MKGLSKIIALAFLCCSCGRNNPVNPVIPQQNNPPNKPQTSGPFYSYKDSLVTIAAFAKDPDEDSLCYRFNWGDGSISDWTDYVASGDPQSMGYKYQIRGVYRIRAEAKDIKGEKSGWSIAREIWIN